MRRILRILIALAILVAIGVGLYWAAAKSWGVVSGANPDVAAALIAASATVLVAAFSVSGGRLLENRGRLAEEHRVRKAPIYQELQEFFFKVLFAAKMGQQAPNEQEIVRFFAEFTPRLSVWASNKVIRAFVDFRKLSVQIGQHPASPESAVHLMLAYERFIFEVRSDLGQSNAGLNAGDLLSLFIADIESLQKRAP